MSATNTETTDWFPPSVTPVRIGWYARRYVNDGDGIQYMNYWDGKEWRYNEDQRSNVPATLPGKLCAYNVCWFWRGLVAPYMPPADARAVAEAHDF